ncbi:hypothetical protein [Acinetobacter venetianus]|uniref:Uncharacterized protein n=1 Tax=Acinetobacter venetianus TaxID=52133 RepID=A0A150I0X6_9GAMM|nr:hypothetical protein [Acinetobacter venetianus]KXZ73259.1 hypothetical protein AVENLUH13518_00033 [Acinetobacter venetianus]
MKKQNFLLIVFSLFTMTNAYSEIDQKMLGDTVKKMSMYEHEVDLNEDRKTFSTYIAPVKVSTKQEFDYVKKLFSQADVLSGLIDVKYSLCNQIGVQYSYLDFLKLNKQIDEKRTNMEVKITESHIKGYSSLFKAQTGKMCSDLKRR